MKNDFQRHKKSDGVKWVITSITILLIIAMLAGVIAAIVTETNPKDWFNQTEDVEIMPTSMSFSANKMSGGGIGSYQRIQATVLPEDATNKNVVWSVAFENSQSAWATGKTASDYVSVVPDDDDNCIATVTCLQPFGEKIIVTATSESNSSVKQNCTIDYLRKPTAFNGVVVGNSLDEDSAVYFDKGTVNYYYIPDHYDSDQYWLMNDLFEILEFEYGSIGTVNDVLELA